MRPFPAAALMAALVFTAGGCDTPTPGSYPGYIEGEFVYISAPLGGTIRALHVSKGDSVRRGEPLFELDPVAQQAALDDAKSRYLAAKSDYADLIQGARPSELAALEAEVDRAEAAARLAEKEAARVREMLRANAVSQEQADIAEAGRLETAAGLKRARETLATARLGARDQRARSAAHAVNAAMARVADAEWRLAQMSAQAPADAVVEEVIRRPGEWVAPGAPALSLLPPANKKARFFVPETRIAALRKGAKVSVAADGVAAPAAGEVVFIAPRAEFTQPFIYSKETRARLVFMVEAALDPRAAEALPVGLPVEVSLAAK